MAAFSETDMSENVQPMVSTGLEEFVYVMYGIPNETNVKNAGFSIFSNMYSPKKNEETPMNKIKSTDPSFLPPCKDSLQQKIKRSNYVAHVWKNDNHSNSVEYQAHNIGSALQKTINRRLFGLKAPSILKSLEVS